MCQSPVLQKCLHSRHLIRLVQTQQLLRPSYAVSAEGGSWLTLQACEAGLRELKSPECSSACNGAVLYTALLPVSELRVLQLAATQAAAEHCMQSCSGQSLGLLQGKAHHVINRHQVPSQTSSVKIGL